MNTLPVPTADAKPILFDQRGFTYLMLMAAIVLMGVSATVVGKQWKVTMQRDQEAELLFRGNRIKAAIEAYAADYEVRKATRPNRYPLSLKELTEKKPTRYLQVVYKDPITGEDFELIKVGKEIRGVKSRSKDRPLNKVEFKGAETYNQIAFQVTGAAGGSCGPAVNPLNPFAPTTCAPGSGAPFQASGHPTTPAPPAGPSSGLPH